MLNKGPGLLFIVSAPSGAGKTTLVERLVEQTPQLRMSRSYTSRPGRQADLPFVKEWVKWGAGLRASQSLILSSKARALMQGRYHVSVADIRALAHPILRHRIIPADHHHVEVPGRLRARVRHRHRCLRRLGIC